MVQFFKIIVNEVKMTLEKKAKFFKALGSETRLKILQNILQSPYVCDVNIDINSSDLIKQATCVGTIAKEFDFSLPTISRHLKELKEANVIKMNKVSNKIYVEPNYETLEQVTQCLNQIVQEGINHKNKAS